MQQCITQNTNKSLDFILILTIFLFLEWFQDKSKSILSRTIASTVTFTKSA
jgi:hypothetical protein